MKTQQIQSIFGSLLDDPNADVRDLSAKFIWRCRSLFGEDLFKNVDKNINNKDILSKFTDTNEEDQPKNKSRSQDKSANKSRSYSKKKVAPKNEENDEVSKKSYSFKINPDGKSAIDIT